ncbi:MAG TPA: ATP synthase F1 subunit gamma [Firmicutes bacterium]|nr:ATP synthase F1 subunit gamma [Bacillota bacterium]
MQGIRQIKRRIRSVKNTRQITRAMKMVAAARLRRAQERVVAARPYAAKMEEIFRHVARHKLNLDDPLFQEHAGGNKICYLVVAADRGLCGAYNANIIRKAMVHAERLEREWPKTHPDVPAPQFSFITVGKKGRDFLSFRNYYILRDFNAGGDLPTLDLTQRIADDLTRRYVQGEVDQVYLVYSEFISVMSQKPTVRRLLPLSMPKDEEEAAEGEQGEDGEAGEAAGTAGAPGKGAEKAEAMPKVAQKDRREGGEEESGPKVWVPDYTLEPSPEVILAKLIPRYLEVLILQALLEGKAGEFGARMTAMDNATKNAEEMIKNLTLSFNRARQAGITQEIGEIIGGAEALRG